MAGKSTRSKPYVLFPGTEADDPVRGLPDFSLDILSEHFQLISLARYDQEPQLKDFIEGVITIGPLHKKLSPVIQSLPSLKVISSWGAGYDFLLNDLDSYKKRGIKVAFIPNAVTRATADFTFALLMASARNIVSGIEEASSPERFQGFHLHRIMGSAVGGATIGIFGMGRIGYGVARRARGFDMTVLYHNRNRRPVEEESSVKATYYSDLTQMVPLCDYLVICCPLTPDTHHLINHQVLNLMKKSAILVNTARGGVVNTEDLVETLKAGSIRGAALDVTDPEPLPDGHPLLTLPNALITAHRGSCDRDGRLLMWQETCDNLRAVLVDGVDAPGDNKLC